MLWVSLPPAMRSALAWTAGVVAAAAVICGIAVIADASGGGLGDGELSSALAFVGWIAVTGVVISTVVGLRQTQRVRLMRRRRRECRIRRRASKSRRRLERRRRPGAPTRDLAVLATMSLEDRQNLRRRVIGPPPTALSRVLDGVANTIKFGFLAVLGWFTWTAMFEPVAGDAAGAVAAIALVLLLVYVGFVILFVSAPPHDRAKPPEPLVLVGRAGQDLMYDGIDPGADMWGVIAWFVAGGEARHRLSIWVEHGCEIAPDGRLVARPDITHEFVVRATPAGVRSVLRGERVVLVCRPDPGTEPRLVGRLRELWPRK